MLYEIMGTIKPLHVGLYNNRERGYLTDTTLKRFEYIFVLNSIIYLRLKSLLIEFVNILYLLI